MKVFTDSVCWFVAESLEDAYAVAQEFDGMTRGDRDDNDGQLEECDGSAKLAILVNEAGQIDDHGSRLNLMMCQWAEREGRGFLCSSEY